MTEPAGSRVREPRQQRRRKRSMTWVMKPGTRKAWLIAHVVISVGWFGGGYAMLVMGIFAMSNIGTSLRPAAYELMHFSDLMIMIPGSLGALITGLVLGLYTKWRVLHHWWVAVKLLLTIGAMVFAYAYVAQNVKTALAATLNDVNADIGRLSESVIAGSSVMLAVLFATTLLSIVKPWGRTGWGRKALSKRRPAGGTR
ncbi:hypothetical protein FHS29_004043 [Saccharothrix tamanrassetensis]|uniref:DUF2269 domain-containing protein n=1 Tax=Saccharothrix tamanrassetensis TaxID=1051531 RepID=A0A841CMT4_9PSEU|nr:hypothetical protein [Saccharothrix tamanrassetensis]MBB5957448.1 hypothetical protein [Saccharothrix tamanrassetensis]